MNTPSKQKRSPQQGEAYSEQEIALRRDEAVRRALNTPPKPYKDSKALKMVYSNILLVSIECAQQVIEVGEQYCRRVAAPPMSLFVVRGALIVSVSEQLFSTLR